MAAANVPEDGAQTPITLYMNTSGMNVPDSPQVNTTVDSKTSPVQTIYQKSKRKYMSDSPVDNEPLIIHRDKSVTLTSEQFNAIMEKLSVLDTIAQKNLNQ